MQKQDGGEERTKKSVGEGGPRSSVEMFFSHPSATSVFPPLPRPIDIVLVYKLSKKSSTSDKWDRRAYFEKGLLEEGLEIERDVHSSDTYGFLKIHAPFKVLAAWADLHRYKMPLRNVENTRGVRENPESFLFLTGLQTHVSEEDQQKGQSKIDTDYGVPEDLKSLLTAADLPRYTTEFTCKKLKKFQRIAMVADIMATIRSDPKNHLHHGIKRLIRERIYIAMFPLHDGRIHVPPKWKKEDLKNLNRRSQLVALWSSMRNLLRPQPITLIQSYLGINIAVYFAWLEYYTMSLIIPSLLGISVLIFGGAKVWGFGDGPQEELCQSHMADTVMCPRCSVRRCSTWTLGMVCTDYTLAQILDNYLVPAFAMSICAWGTISVKLWIRRENKLRWTWTSEELKVTEEEDILPEYEERATMTRQNRITKRTEPLIPSRDRAWRRVFAYICVSLVILIILPATNFYTFAQVSIQNSIMQVSPNMTDVDRRWYENNLQTGMEFLIWPFEIAMIIVFDWLNGIVAEKTTRFECPRTIGEYERWYSYKKMILAIALFFAPLFITAYKAFTIGRPDPGHSWKILKSCSFGGCMSDVARYMIGILFFRQLILSIIQVYWPKCRNYWKNRKNPEREAMKQWEKDFLLETPDELPAVSEYVGMVIQFGIVVLFSACFPLAPMFAFFNNVFEIRTDASKFIKEMKRTIPLKSVSSRAWNMILMELVFLSYVVNGAIVAFTSDFVPRIVHRWHTGGLDGYINASLSATMTEDIGGWEERFDQASNASVCWFYETIRPPWAKDGDKYTRTMTSWKVITARLVVFIIFVLIAGFIGQMMDFFLPDMPKTLSYRIQKQLYFARNAQLNKETRKKVNKSSPSESPSNRFGLEKKQLDYLLRESIADLKRRLTRERERIEELPSRRRTSRDSESDA